MKVLHVFLSNKEGGPNLRVLRTSEKLKKYDVNFIMVSPKENGNFKKISKNSGFPTYQIILKTPKFFKTPASVIYNLIWFFSIPISIYETYKIIKKENIDIVHLHGLLNIPGAIAAKISGKKLIWHLVGSIYPKWLIKILMPFVIFTSDHMIFIAEDLAKYYLINRLNSYKEKFTIIYNGVDTKKFNKSNVEAEEIEKIKKELSLSENLIVGSIGNINFAKGYEYLIEAASILKKKDYNLQYIIVGDNVESQKSYFKNLKKKILDYSLNNEFRFIGQRSDIREIFCLIDILVVPSIAEGTPMVILEGMAMEKAIISSNVGAISEQIKNSREGLLISPRNPEELSEAIEYLLINDEIRFSMGKKGRETVKNKFSIEKSAKKYFEVYKLMSYIK